MLIKNMKSVKREDRGITLKNDKEKKLTIKRDYHFHLTIPPSVFNHPKHDNTLEFLSSDFNIDLGESPFYLQCKKVTGKDKKEWETVGDLNCRLTLGKEIEKKPVKPKPVKITKSICEVL